MLERPPALAAPGHQRPIVYRETSVFLALGAGLVIAGHYLDVVQAGGPNWPALALRLGLVGCMLAGAGLLWTERSRRLARIGAWVTVAAVAVLYLLLVQVTGASGSPLQPFTFVLAILLPLVTFDFLWAGLAGIGLMIVGSSLMMALDGAPFDAVMGTINAGGSAFACGWLLARAMTRARRIEAERRQADEQAFRANVALVRELREAMANVKTLRGLLPLCAWCGRVRNDAGYWQRIEGYIRAHSEAEFTHGMCPDCMRSHFPADASLVDADVPAT
jgi:hypothetical protein